MDVLLQSFSEPEKTAYLATIAALASADRQASPQEAEFLQQLTEQAQLSPQAAQQVLAAANDASNQSIAQHLDVLKTSDLKYSLVTDILSFAKADGKYSPEEEQMLTKMAAYLGVNPQQVQALDQVVEQTAQQTAQHPDAPANSLLGGSGISDMLAKAGIPGGALMKGLLGILAPILISKVLSGRSGNTGGMMGGMSGGGMGGGLLGTLGGLLGGGLLSGGMGGGSGMGGGLGGLLGGGAQAGGGPNLGGGLGSLMGVLGGLGGQRSYGGLGGGGLGSVLGGLFGRR